MDLSNILSQNMIECVQALLILGALMVANIILGTINSVAISKIKFDKERMKEGIIKAVGIAVGTFALSYAFDHFNLESIGYTHMTILSTAIVVYAIKCMKNIIAVLQIEKEMKFGSDEDNDN